MPLLEFANQNLRLPLAKLGQLAFRPLVEALQIKLNALGLLDPIVDGDVDKSFGPVSPSDGKFGAQTLAALGHFRQLVGMPDEMFLSSALALRLHEATPDLLTPLHLDELDTDSDEALLAKRILRFLLEEKKYWVCRAPGLFNIFYLEGCDERGIPNDDRQNAWNDRRMVIEIVGGQPRILINHAATTEPGTRFSAKELRQIAHIAFGQYKAWTLGGHQFPSSGRLQPALRQDIAKNLRVHRGPRREGGRLAIDALFINQHGTMGAAPAKIEDWSAGCLVGQNVQLHKAFIRLLNTDGRFQRLKKFGAPYFFMTAVLDGEEFHRFKTEWMFRSGATR